MYSNFKKLSTTTQNLRKAAAIGVSAAALLMAATTAHATSLVLNGSFSANSGSNCKISTSGCVTDWGSTGYTFLYTSAASAQTTGAAGVKMWGPSSTPSSSANGFGASPDGGAFL